MVGGLSGGGCLNGGGRRLCCVGWLVVKNGELVSVK